MSVRIAVVCEVPDSPSVEDKSTVTFSRLNATSPQASFIAARTEAETVKASGIVNVACVAPLAVSTLSRFVTLVTTEESSSTSIANTVESGVISSDSSAITIVPLRIVSSPRVSLFPFPETLKPATTSDVVGSQVPTLRVLASLASTIPPSESVKLLIKLFPDTVHLALLENERENPVTLPL